MLLEALVACAGVTLGSVATSLGIDVRGGRVHAEGDLDFRGTLAVAKEAPVGFRAIRLAFELETDATEEELDDAAAADRALLRRLPDARAEPGARDGLDCRLTLQPLFLVRRRCSSTTPRFPATATRCACSRPTSASRSSSTS